MILAFSYYQPIATFYFSVFAFFNVKTLILVLVLQCSTRLATCNLSENELIAKFARVFTSLKLPGIQYEVCGKLTPGYIKAKAILLDLTRES